MKALSACSCACCCQAGLTVNPCHWPGNRISLSATACTVRGGRRGGTIRRLALRLAWRFQGGDGGGSAQRQQPPQQICPAPAALGMPPHLCCCCLHCGHVHRFASSAGNSPIRIALLDLPIHHLNTHLWPMPAPGQPDILCSGHQQTLRVPTGTTEQEEVQVEVTRVLVESYFDIARKNLQDSVPKAIMHFLVRQQASHSCIHHLSALKKPGSLPVWVCRTHTSPIGS